MSLGNYKILNPRVTFRLSLIFFPLLLFSCFPFDQFRTKKKKKKLEIDVPDCSRFWFSLLFRSCIVDTGCSFVNQKCKSQGFKPTTRGSEIHVTSVFFFFFFNPSLVSPSWAGKYLSGFVALVPASLRVPQRLQKGPCLIAPIIKPNIYLNKK